MTQTQIQQEFNELKKLLKDNFINSKPVLSATETATYLNISYSRLTVRFQKKVCRFSEVFCFSNIVGNL